MGKNRMESASRRSLQLVQRWWLSFECSLTWESQRMLACPERRWIARASVCPSLSSACSAAVSTLAMKFVSAVAPPVPLYVGTAASMVCAKRSLALVPA
ncbi:MAG: hypothetical protein BJ554DRAFT_2967 [Olpidium bornovanus]|uniref:Uncharacterized protein n=1 Tax=Olpidium bornovanus TaxID=278681 RepID=A0A8H7ZQ21_9FUNG|nr:MAG: hypothetical protein BJ554DRAFT_2967 [Olpidium bornovanus]